MPCYEYFCPDNGKKIEVRHPINRTLKTWGELCFVSQQSLGHTDCMAPIRRVIHAPYISVPVSNSKLKESGFTKLVRRDDGIYENVTALDRESRYMEAGKPETLPHLDEKIRD